MNYCVLCIAYKDRQNSAAIIRDRLANVCMGFNGLCVVQVVKLVTINVTSPAAPHASLIRWLCIMSEGLPRESMDWMVAVTLVCWFKTRVSVVRAFTAVVYW